MAKISAVNVKRKNKSFNTYVRMLAYFMSFGFLGSFMSLSNVFSLMNLEKAFDILHYVILLFWLIVYGIHIVRTKLYNQKLLGIIILFFIVWFFITVCTGGNSFSIITKLVSMVANLGFIYMATRMRERIFIQSLAYFSWIMVFLNLGYLLLFVDLSTFRYTSFSLIAYRNQILIDLIFGLAIWKLYTENKKRKIGYISYFIMITLTVILCQSATTALGYGIAVLLFTFLYSDKWYNILKPKVVIVGYCIIWCFLIFVRALGVFEIIANITGRDITFSGRTEIWDYTLLLLKNDWLFGIGWHGNSSLGLMLHTGVYSTHNQVLQLLYESGVIVILALFLALYWCFCKCYSKKSFRPLYYCTIIIFVVWLTESSGINQLFAIMPFYFYINMNERCLGEISNSKDVVS